MSNNNDYCFLETYKGIKVRKVNRVTLKFGVVDFKKIIDEVSKSEELSILKVLAYSSMPCDKCKNTNVEFYDKKDNVVKIKRGILSIPCSNGVNIITQNKNKKQ